MADHTDLKVMQLPKTCLKEGQVLTFDIYIHMVLNKNTIHYKRIGDTLTAADLQTIQKVVPANLLISVEHYDALLMAQVSRMQSGGLGDDASAPIVKETAGAILQGLDMNLAAAPDIFVPPAAKAQAALNKASQAVSEMIMSLKNTPSSKAYEKLVKETNLKDPLLAHNYQVSGLAVLMLMAVGATSMEELADIGTAGMVHDLGMASMPKELLDKHLVGEEVENNSAKLVYIRHIDNILKILQDNNKTNPMSPGVLRAIEQHHENWNGSGFKGLAGAKIFRLARILRIADDLCVCLTSVELQMDIKTAFEHLFKKCGLISETAIYDIEILKVVMKSVSV